jgi:hypothetical protein
MHYRLSPGHVREIGRPRPDGVLVTTSLSTDYLRAIAERMGEELHRGILSVHPGMLSGTPGGCREPGRGFGQQSVAEGVQR